MSKELLDALESKLLTAVETIESLRREIDGLKAERRLMEDEQRLTEEKLRGLIGRIDQASSPGGGADTEAGEASTDSDSYDGEENPYHRRDSEL